jgi:hypothetical protein
VSDREENEDMVSDIPMVQALRKAAEQMNAVAVPSDRVDREQRVRATLAPRPKLHYPAPWGVGLTDQRNGLVYVIDAEGRTACDAHSREAAEAIVLAVNTFAGVS